MHCTIIRTMWNRFFAAVVCLWPIFIYLILMLFCLYQCVYYKYLNWKLNNKINGKLNDLLKYVEKVYVEIWKLFFLFRESGNQAKNIHVKKFVGCWKMECIINVSRKMYEKKSYWKVKLIRLYWKARMMEKKVVH